MFKISNIVLSLTIAFSHCTFTLFAQEVPIMPLSEIKAGMLGVGKTVFEGDSIEEFNVRIIGKLKNFLPKKDIILVELLGDRLQYTGVIGGMSGSPIYINGKLIGAVAYGWTFSKEPLAGITPIEQMLEISTDFDSEGRGTAAPPVRGAAAGRSQAGGALYNPFEPPANPLLEDDQGPDRPAAGIFTAGGASLSRLEVPLIFSGCYPEVIDRYGKIFSRFGLVPFSGGTTGSDKTHNAQNPVFQSGSAISAQLVRGDLSLAATGTLTCRDSSRILAFGHPFMRYGQVDFPMTAAEIVTVLPRMDRSFKISNSTSFMGSIKTDHANGVLGIIGSEPEMIPFDIDINLPGRPVEKFHYELVRHKILTSLLGGLTLFNTLLSGDGAGSEQTFKVKGKIDIKNSVPVKIEDMFAGSAAASMLTLQMQTILQYLYNNYYGPAEVEGMELSLEVSEGFPRAQLGEVYLDHSTVYPGDSIRIDVVLDPFKQPKIKEQFIVVAPEIDEETNLFLLVGAGDQITRIEFQLSPTRFLYTSLDHLIRLINKSKKNNCIYVKVLRQDKGLILGDREMPGLPPSVWTLLKSEKSSGAMLPLNDITVSEFVRPTEFIINGFKFIQVEVKPRP